MALLEGIINVLKPPGMTSHDVVSFTRKLLGIKKVGHGGTLDPAASGVLPIFVGRATKAVEFFEQDDKEYIAEMIFGITTDTGDSQGVIQKVRDVTVDEQTLKKVLEDFLGIIDQLPPMYSAVHYKGKRLYELAREGIVVERKPRKVEIKAIELMDFYKNTARVRVTCSKGTYIRTLCEDIGEKIGAGACLGTLIRIRSGNFNISDSYTLEEMSENLENLLLPIDVALNHMPKVYVTPKKLGSFGRGSRFWFRENSSVKVGDLVRVYRDENFLGVGKITHHTPPLEILKSFYRVDMP